MLREAARRIARRPGLVLALGASNLLVALVATSSLSAALAPLLDRLPGAWSVAAGDDALAAELLIDHPELITSTVQSMLLAVGVYTVLSWLLAGGVLAAAGLDPAERRAEGARGVLAATGRNATRMVAVSAAGLSLRLAPLLLLLATALELGPLARQLAWAGLAAGLVAGALVWGASSSLVTAIVDAARGRALAEPALPPWRALGAALQLARRRAGALAAIAAFDALGFAAVTALQLALTELLPTRPGWSFALVEALAVLGAIGRAAVAAIALVAAALLGSLSTPARASAASPATDAPAG
jgi:hypothetical protein